MWTNNILSDQILAMLNNNNLPDQLLAMWNNNILPDQILAMWTNYIGLVLRIWSNDIKPMYTTTGINQEHIFVFIFFNNFTHKDTSSHV